MAVKKIHHINFLVKDIEEGINRYTTLFGIEGFVQEALPGRGVITARAALGDQWLVLVQPLDADGVPGRHLAEHGEGFFLMSFAVDDLDQASQQVTEAGARMTTEQPRAGLLDWSVQDVDRRDTFGVQIQLCREG
ncbi:MAG: VOC family protein [Halioglobus sp.]